MECSAVACLWPPSPPSHCISAVAAIQHPPSLFTGGSDGAIVHWAIYGHDVLPLALLCGHTAKIVDFALCFPAEAEPASSRPTHFNVPPASLLSACEDGVLCVWSAGSFRCRRRRKLPPWAGTPSHLTEILSFPHRICILCSSGESSKSSVLIVDSGTLLVVQTVFHGNLDVGSVKSLAIIPSPEEMDKEKQAVFLVGGSGKAQFLALSNEYGGPDGEGSSFMNGASSSDSLTSVCGESTSNNAAQAVALSQDGNLLALIFDYHCEFRSVLDDTVMGDISSPGSSLEDSSQKLNLTGGMFLNSVVHDNAFKTTVSDPDSQRCFVLWYNNGSAMVYIVSVLDTLINSEPLYEVPGEPLKSGGESLFHFCQLNDSLVRLESISFSQGDLLVWRPLITIWSIVKWCIEKEDVICSSSILLGEGFFSDFPSIYPTHKVDGRLEDSFHQKESVDSDNLGILSSRKAENGSSLEGRMISCLMVFADELYSQYAVIYGFYHGDIEVIWLRRPVLNTDSMKEDSLHPSNLHATKCSFLGHHGAVLCLAAHHIAASSNNLQVHRILMSGSRDFTVRLWDLDYGSLLLVMHHHIAPVKQIILPLAWTSRPWNDCFLTVGEDGCVALVSLETLRVERMFPGHPNYPSVVVWDSRRGYLACLCRNISSPSDAFSVLYIWDVNSGVRERIIHGSASHSMLDHFCKDIRRSILGGTTSASPLILPIIDDFEFSQSHERKTYLGTAAVSAVDMLQTQGALSSLGVVRDANSDLVINSSTRHVTQRKKHPIICSCPFPGIANLEFDLSTLVSLHCSQNTDEQIICQPSDHVKEQSLLSEPSNDSSVIQGDKSNIKKETLEGYLLRFSLCFLHLWDVDLELDKLLNEEMDVHKPYGFEIASGILGDRGSRTLMFPGLLASLELWKTSSEYCAMRSLLIVSLAQRMISLYHSTTIASSALAAFYTRNFAEKFPDQKPPLLQLLVSFWQDPSEHVRMAARSLFHCAAPRSIPHPLYCQKNTHPGATRSCVNENEQTLAWDNTSLEVSTENSNSTDYEIVSWLESFEIHEWVSCIGGTSQDAMASHIIVAAALVVWYPSKVKSNLAKHVAERLLKLVMSMNDRFSSTAAELLAEGMENSWKSCLGHEIPQLVGDILFQIECLSGTPAKSVKHNPSLDADIRDCLVGILLPSLAMADITGFLNVIEDQIWSTSSDSPVHIVSLKTLVRIVRSSPKSLALHIDKVMNYVLQTMDHSNLVMRKACLTTSLLTLREITRVLPMVALNESATRLAIGDAIGDIANVAIQVYDVQSVAKVKVLDASSPLGLPNFLEGASKSRMATAISALSFSPDGEGLVAFSENGLVLRWWSLGTVWWERLSRHIDPVQCTKLIFIPPWEGFSPNSSRSSIMANIVGKDPRADSEEKSREWDEAERIRLLLHNLDLSYRLQWVGSRRILLTRHSQEVGIFQM